MFEQFTLLSLQFLFFFFFFFFFFVQHVAALFNNSLYIKNKNKNNYTKNISLDRAGCLPWFCKYVRYATQGGFISC